MERTYSFELFGKQHSFLYTAGVMYDAMDKYEMDIGQILDKSGKDKAEAVYYLANAMAKAAGRIDTYDDKEFTPMETLLLETAVIRAINAGNKREYKPKQVSKTLEKIQKKKVVRALLARILYSLLLRVLGLPLTKRTSSRPESSTT